MAEQLSDTSTYEELTLRHQREMPFSDVDGVSERVEDLLEVGQLEEAETILDNCKELDESTASLMADEIIAAQFEVSIQTIDYRDPTTQLLRAVVRKGVLEGIYRGRQEAASVKLRAEAIGQGE